MSVATKIKYTDEFYTNILDDMGLSDQFVRTMTRDFMKRIAKDCDYEVSDDCLQCMSSNYSEGVQAMRNNPDTK